MIDKFGDNERFKYETKKYLESYRTALSLKAIKTNLYQTIFDNLEWNVFVLQTNSAQYLTLKPKIKYSWWDVLNNSIL